MDEQRVQAYVGLIEALLVCLVQDKRVESP